MKNSENEMTLIDKNENVDRIRNLNPENTKEDLIGSTLPSEDNMKISEKNEGEGAPTDKILNVNTAKHQNLTINSHEYRKYIFVGFVAAITAVIFTNLDFFVNFPKFSFTIENSQKTICHNFTNLNETFPMEYTDFWEKIQYQMERIQTEDKPAVFFFVYSNKTLARDVILSNGVDYLNLTTEVFQRPEIRDDKNILVKRYRRKLEEQKIMLVEDVDLISGTVAPVFHHFCHINSPVVPKSIIMFTLYVEKNQIPKQNFVLYVIERLTEVWTSGKNSDEIDALITCILNNVLHIKLKGLTRKSTQLNQDISEFNEEF
uniref:CSON008516 protein n=1 Tax=Culicoides sonorensis TaxID=179676 RepID=A0A336N1W9_CULSO